jgi:hypothetical protein
VKVLFDDAATVMITLLFTDDPGEERPLCFGEDATDISFPKTDIEDAEGKSCFVRGVGEGGADISSESDSSSPVGR